MSNTATVSNKDRHMAENSAYIDEFAGYLKHQVNAYLLLRAAISRDMVNERIASIRSLLSILEQLVNES